MALKKCKECGKEVSSKAKKCPHCGAPTKNKSIGCGGLLMLFLVLAIFGSILNGNESSTSTAAKSSAAPNSAKEIVSNSAWDGSVYQVKRYLEKTLKDPDSFEAIEWSKVTKINLETHKYIVRCKYRAKNSFGGYVIENKIFYLDGSGNIVQVRAAG